MSVLWEIECVNTTATMFLDLTLVLVMRDLFLLMAYCVMVGTHILNVIS